VCLVSAPWEGCHARGTLYLQSCRYDQSLYGENGNVLLGEGDFGSWALTRWEIGWLVRFVPPSSCPGMNGAVSDLG
jgi:hypothetical protein